MDQDMAVVMRDLHEQFRAASRRQNKMTPSEQSYRAAAHAYFKVLRGLTTFRGPRIQRISGLLHYIEHAGLLEEDCDEICAMLIMLT